MSDVDFDTPVPQEAGGTTQAATGIYNIDALLAGPKWNALSLTYMFPNTLTYFDSSYGWPSALQGFGLATAAQQTAAKAAFAALSSFTNLVFTEVSASTITGPYSPQTDITIARSSNPGTAYAFYPGSTQLSGDVWMGVNGGNSNPVKGDYAWHTMWHELGHALGLKHGHETGGVASHALTTDRDSMEFSIMTYRSYIGAALNGYVNETWGYAQSFMMYDIAALQEMYGADFTTNSGNTVYTFSSTTGQMFINGVGQGAPGGNRIFLTLWDGGGIDTYDFSNYTTNLEVDLTPGGWSKLSDAQIAYLGEGHYARANVFNALQYHGDARSLIENAIGGSGNDTIVGNAASNVIEGGNGVDTISGFGGSDTVYGGIGNDIVYGGSGSNDPTDGADYVYGNQGNDTLYGNGGNDILMGGDGFDIVYGGAGSDTIYGGSASGDPSDAADQIYGQGGDDTIYGNGGDDLIYAGNGNDIVYGGAGSDRIFGDDGADTIVAGGGNDILAGGLGPDTFIFAKGQALGDQITDFSGYTSEADILRFTGFSSWATIQQISATQWMIVDGQYTEIFTLANSYILTQNDYIFV